MTENTMEELNNRAYTTEDEALEEEIGVYEFQENGEVKFRTTSSVKFDAFLKKQFDELPPRQDYEKIKGVSFERKKFVEVDN